MAAAVVTVALACGCASRADVPATLVPPGDEELARIAAAVTNAITTRPPEGYAAIPRDLRLRSIERRKDGSIALDFTGELLLDTDVRSLEDAVHQLLAAASSARAPQDGRQDDFMVLVNGVSLAAYRP